MAHVGVDPPRIRETRRCRGLDASRIGRRLAILRTELGPERMCLASGSAARVDPGPVARLCRPDSESTHPSRKRCTVPSFCIGRALAPWIIRTRHGPQPEEKAACSLHVEAPGGPTPATGDPRLVQAQVHPPARAVRSRPFVSAGPFCRGSFALGTGRSPRRRRKPHVHCIWKRW